MARFPESAEAAQAVGLIPAWNARHAPDRPAVLSARGDRTFAELDRSANRLARALRRRGLRAGDALALVCSNQPEFAETYCAALRAGLRLTFVNWHLGPAEMAWILDDSDAKAVVCEARFGETCAQALESAPRARARLVLGGAAPGFEPYAEALAAESCDDLDDPVLGGTMPYTSGTTGRPKGVYRRTWPAPPPAGHMLASAAFRPGEDRLLWPTPLYHAGIIAFHLSVALPGGVAIVMMERFDAEEMLRLVERHRITHTHVVATIFHRLLALPREVRERYDLASLRWIVHGAAPTPAHVKRAVMDWLGPILWEYYAASEGGRSWIGPEEWLARPGSVGRPLWPLEIRDEEGKELAPDREGTLWFRAPDPGRFEYYKDPEKTRTAYRGDWFTVGDRGFLDSEGYLYLCGRSAELILSGGVNVYPAEVDAVLLEHPAVADVATVGVPSEEWGEEVKAVVQPAPGRLLGPDLEAELLAHCRARLARYKCPRSVDFVEELPRLEAGKVQRAALRARYWP